jgi:hypothetical protein
MGELSHSNNLLTRYLLGDLTPAERDQLEEEYFSNDELFLELLEVKDQLTGKYLNGQLTESDRARFEKHLLAQPDCRKEMEIERFFQSTPRHNLIARKSVPQSKSISWWQSILAFIIAHRALAGVSVAALLIMVFAIFQSSQISTLERSQESDNRAALPASANSAAIESLSLKPGRFRSRNDTPTAKVGPGTKLVEIKLEVGQEKYPHYRASLQKADEENSELMVEKELTADQTSVVTWNIPAAKLPIGDYQIKLSGISEDSSSTHLGDYDFRIRGQ